MAEPSLLEQAADALRIQGIYVHPALADELSAAEVAALRSEIASADVGSVYIAVLPEAALAEAGNSADQALRAIAEMVDRDGTYALVAGDTFRAGADADAPFSVGEVPEAATIAAQEAGGDVGDLLTTFVAELDLRADTGGSSAGAGGGLGGLGFVLVLAAGAAGAMVWARRRRRQREAAELAEVRGVAEQDVASLSDEILRLEPEVAIARDSRAPTAFAEASGHFLRARDLLAGARLAADLEPVTRELEEARYQVARTRAAMEGHADPERRPPCFFDPRHGPSTRDVTWAPPGGEPRPVPACEADAVRIEHHEEPQVRELELAGGRRPYWEAPAYYGPWMGGWFGGFGGIGFLNGLMLGSLLGGPGWGLGGWGYGGYGGYGYGGGEGGDGGGAGGGDFGGGFGDFGGGDFGGGDFGGGDF